LKHRAWLGFLLLLWALQSVAEDWERIRDQAETDSKALAQLQRAARAGNAQAAFYLGTLYAPPITKATRTVPKDWGKAIHWYQQAADWGDAKAAFDLGLAYEKGQGMAKNPAMARYYFRRMMALAAEAVGVPATHAEQVGTGNLPQ